MYTLETPYIALLLIGGSQDNCYHARRRILIHACIGHLDRLSRVLGDKKNGIGARVSPKAHPGSAPELAGFKGVEDRLAGRGRSETLEASCGDIPRRGIPD